MYILGTDAGRSYVHNYEFLSSVPNLNEIGVYSTQSSGTLMSTESFLEGLYPGTLDSFDEISELPFQISPPVD